MLRTLRMGGVLLIGFIFLASCAKLPPTPAKEGALPVEKLAQTNSVPADWGRLTSATISPDFPRQVQLWFQNDQGEIRLVFYDMPQNKLMAEAIVLRRN